MGLAYLRSNHVVFSSLSVDEHRKIAKTTNYLFDIGLNGNSKGSFLSGGEKQKLLIDMLPEADVYLLDEPMIGLDKAAISKTIDMIRQLVKMRTILITIPEWREFKLN
jgi:ABC-type multidrug transport system ATPase subunit